LSLLCGLRGPPDRRELSLARDKRKLRQLIVLRFWVLKPKHIPPEIP
jgi:hypothetical protein